MKLSFTYITVSLLFLSGCIFNNQSSPKEFDWYSMEDAQFYANQNGKKILVNVYTDWCEYCKKMDDTVYRDSLIRASIVDHYYAVRLNADSDSVVKFNGVEISQYELAREMGIRSYPTILFLDAEGSLILQINGFMPKNDFSKMITFIGEDIYQRTDFHEFASGGDNRRP